MISTEDIKKLREETGLSVMLCKKALEESDGNQAEALLWLKKQGIETAKKKSARTVKSGRIEVYVHGEGQIGVLLEIKSETDFVAKNPEFKELAKNIAMHIAASAPANVEELLEQPYIRDLSITITDFINKAIQKFGEKIEVARFERYTMN